MQTVTLTYVEIAKRLSITVSSAKNTARRKGWARTVGNDRKARVRVPIEALPTGDDEGPSDTLSSETPPMGNARGLQEALAVALVRVEMLEEQVVRTEQDRDRWNALAGELRADLEQERVASRSGLLVRLFGRAA